MKRLLKQKNKDGILCHISFADQNGFTLVETLIAISIFSVSIVALMSFLAQGISTTSYVKEKITAEYLAQEGIESLRNMRDNYVLYPTETGKSWDSFKAVFDASNFDCALDDECGFNNSLVSDDQNFIFKCSSSVYGCALFLDNGNYNSDFLGDISNFTRTIWVENIDADEIRIYSKVKWIKGSGPYSITFSEDLFNWVE